MSSKGIIPGYVILGAALALLVVAVFFIILLKFYSSSEITISDKIADGLSSINYFYLTEKNINEFAQIVTETTAKDLGENCGGIGCYSWTGSYPSYDDLRNKFDETLRGKITGFPTQIGNGGRISFASPRISGLEMDEGNVKISLFPQQVYRKTNSFLVNASSEKQAEIDKQIRYLLLARIGQQLYGNGTYVRDSGRIWINSGKFDCNNDGDSGDTGETISAKTKLSDSSLNNCKIIDIDFNVDDIENGKSKWNSYNAKCYNILNSADPGEFAGKLEGGKIYVQIDSLLEKSLVCGIDATDGLAGINDFIGETSDTTSVGTDSDCRTEPSEPKCSKDDAVKTTDYVNLESRTSAVLSALKSLMHLVDGGVSADFTLASTKGYEINTNSPVPKTSKCPDYSGSCGSGCTQISSTGNVCSSGASSLAYSCQRYAEWHKYGNSCQEKVWTGAGSYPYRFDSTGCFDKKDISINDNWQNGEYSHFKDTCYGTYSCVWDSCIDPGDCPGGGSSYCCLVAGYTMSKSYVYEKSCYYKGSFKFTFTPDITFKIIDTTGNKIVKKGTTDFEDLYFAVKFKPGEPYVIGDPNYIPPTEYTCEKTSGQTCETSCSASGKTSGSGTCETGKVCCKPQESKIIITGEGKDITI